MKTEPTALPADPSDVEDFDATAEALDRGQRAPDPHHAHGAWPGADRIRRALPGAGWYAARLGTGSCKPTRLCEGLGEGDREVSGDGGRVRGILRFLCRGAGQHPTYLGNARTSLVA